MVLMSLPSNPVARPSRARGAVVAEVVKVVRRDCKADRK